jgi:putative tryptophan/tyrosine transport system substrate-binding protein
MRRREFIASLVGAAVAVPCVAGAQQPAVPVIGLLTVRSADTSAGVRAAFLRGLNETGFVENRNVGGIAGRRASSTDCLRWPPTLSAVRSA